MNLTIKRYAYLAAGIFGELESEDQTLGLFTLEHSYKVGDQTASGSYAPKIPPGTYTCVRGQHQLEGMSAPFTTFEVTNVPGHTGILFHPGNTNSDSSGCILLGAAREGNSIVHSRDAFNLFMEKQSNNDSFLLVVS